VSHINIDPLARQKTIPFQNKSELNANNKSIQKSVEKHNVKNTNTALKNKPSLNIKNTDKSHVRSRDSKNRSKDTSTRRSGRTGRSEKRNLIKDNKRNWDSTYRKSSNIFIGNSSFCQVVEGISSSIKTLKKRYASAHKHRTTNCQLLPEMSQKNLKQFINDCSGSQSRKTFSKKRGSLKKIPTKSDLHKMSSQCEYGLEFKADEAGSWPRTKVKQNTDYKQKTQLIVSNSNFSKTEEKSIKHSNSYYKNKSKRSASQSSNSKSIKSKYSDRNHTQITSGIANFSSKSKDRKVSSTPHQ